MCREGPAAVHAAGVNHTNAPGGGPLCRGQRRGVQPPLPPSLFRSFSSAARAASLGADPGHRGGQRKNGARGVGEGRRGCKRGGVSQETIVRILFMDFI